MMPDIPHIWFVAQTQPEAIFHTSLATKSKTLDKY